jgi:HAD superfamily hydrolase (TIGR01509 family)
MRPVTPEETIELPRAILFDMDGTLTAPMLDFPRIKSEMGIAPDRPIIEALAEMSGPRRDAAEEVLHRHEEQAAACSTLNPGCRDLLAWLKQREIRLALITRNSERSVRTVVERHGLAVDLTITRECARPKPDPEALHLACRRLEVREAEAWMVGDGQYDVEAGNAAAVRTVWISHSRSPRPFAAQPWREVADLHGLAELLRSCGQPMPGPRV